MVESPIYLVTCPDDARPFYEDEYEENRMAAGQIYEWAKAYLFL